LSARSTGLSLRYFSSAKNKNGDEKRKPKSFYECEETEKGKKGYHRSRRREVKEERKDVSSTTSTTGETVRIENGKKKNNGSYVKRKLKRGKGGG